MCDPRVLEFVLLPSLAAGLAVRYQPRVVRSPAAHAPGVRSGRSCHTQPTRPWESPVRPAVGSGRSSHTRLQQPASRSASGRVLSPPYAAARPNARSTGARGQRASRPARAHTLRAVVRSAAVTRSSAPVQSISQRGRQRLTAAATQQPPHATGIRLPAAPPAADAQQRPPEAVPEPRQPLLRPPNSPAPQRAPAGSWQPTRCHMPPRTPPHLKTASPDGRRRPSRYNCSCNRPPKARRAPWPCPPP